MRQIIDIMNVCFAVLISFAFVVSVALTLIEFLATRGIQCYRRVRTLLDGDETAEEISANERP